MRITRTLLYGLLGPLALGLALQAHATLYNLDFNGGGTIATGQIDVESGAAVSGYLQILSGDNPFNNGTPYALYPGQGNWSTPPGYQFTYDNLVDPTSDPFLDLSGLLFYNPSSQVVINLWGNSPGSYSLYGYPPQWSPAVDSGMATLTLAPVPEPGTVAAGALLLLPFGAVAIRVLRKSAAV